MSNIIAGKKYICKESISKDGEVLFVEGEIYVCQKNGQLIDEHNCIRTLSLLERECFDIKTVERFGYWEKLWHEYTGKIFSELLSSDLILEKIIDSNTDINRVLDIYEKTQNLSINMAAELVDKIRSRYEKENKQIKTDADESPTEQPEEPK